MRSNGLILLFVFIVTPIFGGDHPSSMDPGRNSRSHNDEREIMKVECLQQDTVGRDRRSRKPPKEETKTDRYKIPEKNKSTAKDNSDQSFGVQCFSSCFDFVFSGCLSMIFSSADKKDSLPQNAIDEAPITPQEYDKLIKIRSSAIPALSEQDSVKDDSLSSDKAEMPDTAGHPVPEALSTGITPRIDTLSVGEEKMNENAKISLTRETGIKDSLPPSTPAPEPLSGIKGEPLPDIRYKIHPRSDSLSELLPAMSFARVHLGLMLGGSYMWGETDDEYDSLNFWLGFNGGIILSKNFEITMLMSFAWYSGTPQYQYVTLTKHNTGDLTKIISLPEDISFRTTSYGIGGRLILPFTQSGASPVIGMAFGISCNYVKFFEKSKIYQEEYFNLDLEREETIVTKREFDNISYSFDIGFFLTDQKLPLWGELSAGVEVMGLEPHNMLPFSLDFSGYAANFFFGIGCKYRIFEL